MVQTPFQQESLPPALESGDHLNRSEFERRYNAMPSLQKAELIEGVVYLPAALRFSRKYGESVVSFARRFSFGGKFKVCREVSYDIGKLN